jgi:amino acid adenylation domain-containing protein
MADASPKLAAGRYPGPQFGPDNGFVPVPADLAEGGIPSAFERRAAAGPGLPALLDGERAWSYDSLNHRANRLARAIRAAAPDPARPLAILLPHGAQAVIGVLAALKAGKFYVAIEPSYPAERVDYLLEDSQADALLADAGAVAPRPGLPVLDAATAGEGLCEEDLRLPVAPDAPAGLYYTSGSTGRPKGVVHSHRAVLHGKIALTNAYHLRPEDRVALTVSLSLSASLNYILCPLLAGASVHCFDVRRRGLGAMARWLRADGITFFYSVPTIFRKLMAAAGEEGFPGVRLLGLGGEAVLQHDIELFRNGFRRGSYLRLALGMSEVSGGVTRMFISTETRLPEGPVPVGYAAPGVELLLLDEEGRPAPDGQAGHLAVRSRYLALGYWRRPELTAQKFLPDPDGGERRVFLTGDLALRTPEGCYFHVGRRDSMVKVRGQRVETAEVEAALLALGGFAGVAVAARPDRQAENVLVAYVVPDGSRPARSAGELWDSLRAKLPPALLPGEFVTMDALPMTAVGKVDRAALPDPHGRGEAGR